MTNHGSTHSHLGHRVSATELSVSCGGQQLSDSARDDATWAMFIICNDDFAEI